MIIQHELLQLDRLKFAELLPRLEVQFLARCDFVARGNHHDVALLAHIQTLLLEDDIDDLVGRHILQDQCGCSGHRFADHGIQTQFFGHQTEQRTHVAILVIDTDPRSLITRFGTLHQLVRVLDDTLYLDHELVFALVSVVFPQPLRGNGHPYILTECLGFDRVNRCPEIRYIQFTAEIIGNRRFDEIDHQILALLANVNTSTGIAQIDNNARLTVLATPEGHILHGMAFANRRLFGEAGHTLRKGF